MVSKNYNFLEISAEPAIIPIPSSMIAPLPLSKPEEIPMNATIAIATGMIACLAFSIDAAEYRANEVANGFQIPWGIEFLDKQQMIVNEKNGTVSLLNIASGKQQTLFTANRVER